MATNSNHPVTTTFSGLSLVIPTRNEQNNILMLVSQIETTLAQQPTLQWEIIFVDDSDDATPVVVKSLQLERPELHIRLHHRALSERTGLATAVTAGIGLAEGSHVLVMDADLQHPPALILQMWEQAQQYDVVMPSRYMASGVSTGLANTYRKVVSESARFLPRLLFPRLRKCTDPLGGYFLIRKDCIALDRLNPSGWKIGLEILVLSNYQSYIEIPYSFQARWADESKANLKVGLAFIGHLLSLFDRYYFSKPLISPELFTTSTPEALENTSIKEAQVA